MRQTAPNQPDWPEGVRLLMGVGAQKAGTSWVFHYLNGHPACRPGPMKELHYFDTLAGISKVGHVLRGRKERALAKRGRDAAKRDGVKRLQEICEAPDDNHQSYVDLMTGGLAPGQVALDITPSYAVLDAATFGQMAALGDTRFLFLMREPVARLWSAVRMKMAKKVEVPAMFEAACQERLDLMLEGGRAKEFARSDYAGTLARLDQAVPARRRLALFCENLFTQQAADRICDFLEIARHPLGDLGVVNEGMRAVMRPDQETALAARLRPQYEAICAAFGKEVPQAWHARFAARPRQVVA